MVLAAVAAQLMFVSAHDALLLMVVVVFAGAIAVRAAQLFATTAIRDVEALRDTLVAVGEGSRTPAAVDRERRRARRADARGQHGDRQARPTPRPRAAT